MWFQNSGRLLEVLGLYSKTEVGEIILLFNFENFVLSVVIGETITIYISTSSNFCQQNRWVYFHCLNSHSEVFNDGFRKKVIDGRMIKSLCLFRVWTLYICSCCKYIHAYRHKLHRGCNISLTDQKNIKPEWEDPANAGGCEFHATRTLTKENVDQLWENLVFAVIGSLLILYLWELYTYMK